MIVLDISTMCNLRCCMCSLDKYYEKKGIMSTDTFGKLIPYMSSINYVSLSCNGEPLLNKNIIEMLSVIKDTSQGKAVVGFTTNGTLLTREASEKLILNNLESLDARSSAVWGSS